MAYQVIGALISILGVCIVLSRGDWLAILQVQFVYGDLLMVLATILWAFYSWMLTKPGDQFRAQLAMERLLTRPSFIWLNLVFCIYRSGVAGRLYAF
jgi:drug/metabolite transporter (DMT)-like permease